MLYQQAVESLANSDDYGIHWDHKMSNDQDKIDHLRDCSVIAYLDAMSFYPLKRRQHLMANVNITYVIYDNPMFT